MNKFNANFDVIMSVKSEIQADSIEEARNLKVGTYIDIQAN